MYVISFRQLKQTRFVATLLNSTALGGVVPWGGIAFHLQEAWGASLLPPTLEWAGRLQEMLAWITCPWDHDLIRHEPFLIYVTGVTWPRCSLRHDCFS